jgi:branched-chain amino acid transport system substrate-binding protein
VKGLTWLFLAALALMVTGVACSDDDDSPDPTLSPGLNPTSTADAGPTASGASLVTIGAMLPLTGALDSYGEAAHAALEAAVASINADSTLQIELSIKDTATDPATVLDDLQAMHDEGIRIVVGPFASSTVEVVLDLANEQDIIILGPLSTATSLAIPGDNLFRFTPTDEANGIAVAHVLLNDGITTAVHLSRDDPGNLGLQSGMKIAYEAAGGTVVPGITYPASDADFDAVVTDLIALLEGLETPLEETAIYLTAFGEVTQLFEAASANGAEVLTALRWYGSDSVALSAGLVENETAAAFAVRAVYPNPILGLRDEDRQLWEPVVDAVEAVIGRTPDTFALAAYDALVVAHMALQTAGVDADIQALRDALVTAAAGHVGLTGPTVLNEAGDRDSGSYDFWSICPDGNAYTWKRTISFVPGPAGASPAVQHYDC